ncbi:HNH endonuclease [Massilia sp. B-10]|nr:HNH endonuclease [Massilia sp. B-10]
MASHIKPWAICIGHEHLDAANGLALAPHADHLFDTGMISFEDDGHILIAPGLDRSILQAWHIDSNMNVGPFAIDQALYMAFHRAHVFNKPRIRRARNLVGDCPVAE